MPANKIVLGLGTYGRAFGLSSPSANGLGATRNYGYTPKGEYTQAEGFLAYYEICKMGLKVVEENVAKAPYGYKDKDWVGFDNPKSLIYKIDYVVKKNSLRGVMFWAIDLDDFSGQHCGQGKYPLMNAVKKFLTSGVQPPPVTNPPPPFTTQAPPPPPVTTQAPLPPATISPGGGGSCKATGPWTRNSGMDAWCKSNCALGNCPASHCKCT